MAEVEILSEDECWALLTGAVIGRLVYAEGDDVEIFPVNFMVHDRKVLFRTAPGSKLEAVGSRPNVAFEVDEHGPIWVWSVIVRGRAERMSLGRRDRDLRRARPRVVEPRGEEQLRAHHALRLSGRRFRLPTPSS